MASKDYPISVFINCPFDDEYAPIRFAIIFAVFDCGFIPRSAMEVADGADVRVDKIHRLISQCKFGIHDISRTELDEHNNLPRFNMPLELGIFLGARRFGDRDQKKKICLILDRERFRFQKFISDISGQDIQGHGDQPNQAIRAVREWLNSTTGRKTIPGGALISHRFQQFLNDLPEISENAGLELDEVTYNDYCNFASDWLQDPANAT